MAADGAQGADDARGRKILDAALAVFGRYGYRKTSMEEIARAAEVSRQTLYLRYPTKEALFAAGVEYVIGAALAGVRASLADEGAALEARLAGALDAWMGPFVGMPGVHAMDAGDESNPLVGERASQAEAQCLDLVTKAVRAAGLAAAYRLAGLTAPKLASLLYATAKGLKLRHKTRAEFVADLTLAARVFCAPLDTSR